MTQTQTLNPQAQPQNQIQQKVKYVLKINININNAISTTNFAIVLVSSKIPSKFDVETLTRLYTRILRLRLGRGLKYVTALVQKVNNINVIIEKPFEPILYFNHVVPLHLEEVMLSIANEIKVNVVNQQLFQQLQQFQQGTKKKLVVLGFVTETTLENLAKDLNGDIRKITDDLYVVETSESAEKIFCRAMRVINDTMRFATIDYVLRRINLHVLADAEPVTVYSFELRYR